MNDVLKILISDMKRLRDEINESANSTEVTIDGRYYLTDWNYGIEAIDYFIEIFERRHE